MIDVKCHLHLEQQQILEDFLKSNSKVPQSVSVIHNASAREGSALLLKATSAPLAPFFKATPTTIVLHTLLPWKLAGEAYRLVPRFGLSEDRVRK